MSRTPAGYYQTGEPCDVRLGVGRLHAHLHLDSSDTLVACPSKPPHSTVPLENSLPTVVCFVHQLRKRSRQHFNTQPERLRDLLTCSRTGVPYNRHGSAFPVALFIMSLAAARFRRTMLPAHWILEQCRASGAALGAQLRDSRQQPSVSNTVLLMQLRNASEHTVWNLRRLGRRPTNTSLHRYRRIRITYTPGEIFSAPLSIDKSRAPPSKMGYPDLSAICVGMCTPSHSQAL